MTAKFLEQYMYLKARIPRLRCEIEDLRRTNNLPTAVKGSRPEIPYDCHEIPIGAERISFDLAIQIQGKKSELECAIADKNEIEQFIEKIQDEALREIFIFRYLHGETWKEVAAHFGYAATEESVKKKTQRYLQSRPRCPKCPETV